MGKYRHSSYKQRLVHYTHFSGFVVSGAVVIQALLQLQFPSWGDAMTPGAPEVADCWDLSCTEARKLWLGAGLWDNTAWC